MFENNSLQVELNKYKEDNNQLNEQVSDLKSNL
jgi:FtsZ-binding cell division protein ZapB